MKIHRSLKPVRVMKNKGKRQEVDKEASPATIILTYSTPMHQTQVCEKRNCSFKSIAKHGAWATVRFKKFIPERMFLDFSTSQAFRLIWCQRLSAGDFRKAQPGTYLFAQWVEYGRRITQCHLHAVKAVRGREVFYFSAN